MNKASYTDGRIDRSPRGVAARNGLSYATVYKEIREGRLVARKVGTRTIIPEHEERAWLDNLPAKTGSNPLKCCTG